LTSYEQAIGIGKSRVAGKKPKKHKLCENEEQRCAVVTKKSTRRHFDTAATKVTGRTAASACECEMTADPTHSHSACSRRCRGWFLSSWPESDGKSGHFSSDADRSALGFHETLTKRTCSRLAELCLECSSAAKWSELKRSQREDAETLLSSPAGVLWRGNVKPLVRPSQATSAGKICFSLLITVIGCRKLHKCKN